MSKNERYQCQGSECVSPPQPLVGNAYHVLAEHALHAMMAFNSQGRITLWNPVAELLFGYSAEEALGQIFTELLLPLEERLHTEHRIRRILDEGICEISSPCILEITVLNKQGKLLRVSFSLFNPADDDTEVMVVVCARPPILPGDSKSREQIAGEIRESVHKKQDLDEIMALAVRRLGEFMQTDRCVIWLYNAETDTFQKPRHEYLGRSDIASVNDLPDPEWPYFCNQLSRTEPLYIPDINALPLLDPDDMEARRVRPLKSLLHIPLTYDRRFYGFLRFHSIDKRAPWDEQMVALAQDIGKTLAMAIDEARREAQIKDELRERGRQRDALIWLCQRAMGGLSPEAFFELAARSLNQLLGLELCRILELTSLEQEQFKVLAMVQEDQRLHSPIGTTGSDSLAAYTIKVSQPVWVVSAQQETRFPLPEWMHESGASSAISVLIQIARGVYGVLQVASIEERAFKDSDVFYLQTISNILGLVIDRYQAQQLAEEKTNLYEMLLDTASYAIWDLNLETGNLNWNENTYELLGLLPATYSPTIESAKNLVHPEDWPLLENLVQQVVAQDGSCELEYRIRHSSGVYKYVRTQFTVILDDEGKPVHLVGMTFDINRRKQDELLLKESEARFRSLADELPVLLWMADTQLNVLYANRAYREFYGLSMEELLGQSSEQIIHPDELSDVLQFYRKAVEERQPYNIECRVKRFDGEYRWLIYRGVPRILSSGEFLGFIGIAIDITERKLMEQQLLESEERFRNMADAAPALIGLTDRQGKLIYMNQACIEFAAMPLEELMNDAWRAQVVFPSDQDAVTDAYRVNIIQQKRFTFEYRAIRHDGAVRNILNTAAPRFRSDGEFLGYIIIGTDITEPKEAMSRFQRLADSNIIGISQWRADGTVVDANEAFLQAIGYSRQELDAGQLNAKTITPAGYELADEAARQELIQKGVCTPYEKQFLHKDGHRVDIIVGEASLGDKADEEVAFIVDITYRQQIERTLQSTLERERLRRRLMELSGQSLDMAGILDTIASEVGRYYKADRCLLIGYEPLLNQADRLMPTQLGQYRVSRQLERITLDGFQNAAGQQGIPIANALQPVAITDLKEYLSASSAEVPENTYLYTVSTMLDRYGIKSCLRAGIRYRDFGFGSLVILQCANQREWTPEEVSVLDDLAYQIGSVLYQAKLHEQEQQAKRELEWNLKREQLRRRVLQISSERWDMDQVAQMVTEEVGRFFEADRCCLFRYLPGKTEDEPMSMDMGGQYLSGPDIEPIDFHKFPAEFIVPLAMDLTQSTTVHLDLMPTREIFFDYVTDRMKDKPLSESEKQAFCVWVTAMLFDEYSSKSIFRIDIIYRGKVYGTLTLHYCRAHKNWREEESDVLYDIVYYIGSIYAQAELREQEQQARRELEKSYNLIRIVSEAQGHFISNEEPRPLFADLLNKLLLHTESQFGFMGEVLYDTNGVPYLKLWAISNTDWDEPSRRLYEQSMLSGLEIHDLNTCFGKVIAAGTSIISNEWILDPQQDGLPAGCPPLTDFMGLPLYKGSDMVGMVGIANRPDGYDAETAESLQPYLLACANIICGFRTENEKAKLTLELKRSEQSLKNYATRLERSNQELDQFATMVSHDLQAPLRKVIVFSDFIKTTAGDNLPLDCYDYIERIQKAVLRMQSMISDLLTLSRVTRKGKPFQPVNLKDVIDEVLSDLESYRHDHGGTIDVQETMIIDADETQMRQVFQNLIGNALKFHAKNTPPHIEVRIVPVAENICEIRVRDWGIGFDPQHLDRIFDVFERLHGEQAYEGTGMGLAIVKKIAERHGGFVTAESRPGHGATFIVRLPIRH